jgi:hypothetical protein
MAAFLLFSGCTPKTTPQKGDFGGLICMEYSRYTGTFPEDGSGRDVENVAAILVHNSSNQFLDYATVEAVVGNQHGTFYVTGLPPGGTAWVLEKNAMTLTPDDKFEAKSCEDYFFREDAILQTDLLKVEPQGKDITVTNQSKKTLKNVCIYYKTVHEDGRYFGGITYLLAFDDLEPGQSVTKQSVHFGSSSRIVRYSYQESG